MPDDFAAHLSPSMNGREADVLEHLPTLIERFVKRFIAPFVKDFVAHRRFN
jgi:hypothetical protein